MEVPDPAHLGSYQYMEASGQFGHSSSSRHRGTGTGVVTTLVPPPVKGAPTNTKLPHFLPEAHEFGEASRMHSVVASLPPINFPRFDGSNPRIWKKTMCELL